MVSKKEVLARKVSIPTDMTGSQQTGTGGTTKEQA